MPHTGIHAISARQNKMNKRWVNHCIFCCRTAAISALFTPLSTFRFQPLPAVATHGVDVDITFHYVTSQFSAFGRRWQPQRAAAAGAGGRAMGWTTPPHHTILDFEYKDWIPELIEYEIVKQKYLTKILYNYTTDLTNHA